MSFEFDPVTHRYRLDGVTIPGISFVLENTGFIDKSWFKPEHAERGHAVHAACQFLIEGNLDWSTVHPDILPRVKAFEQFLCGTRPRLLLAEEPLYSKAWMFGGTPDIVLDMHGVPAVIDIKTGKAGLAAQLQTAAQSILIFERKGITDAHRYALELSKGGSLRMVRHGNHGDRAMFLNALAMIHRRINEKELSLEK